MGTLQAIADKLELSPATVSRALRNLEGVNAKTRERVLKAAKSINYSKGSQTAVGIALIIPGRSMNDVHELAHRYMLAVSNAVSQRCWSVFPVVVDTHNRDCLESINTWPDSLKASHITGCIVIDPISLESRLELHRYFGGRVVMLSRHDIENGISGVRSLDYDGGKLVASKLIEKGHKNIGWIGSIGSYDVSCERRSGAFSVLQEHGLNFATEVWFDERDTLTDEDVASKMKEILPNSRKDWPTAWISSNDWLGAKTMVFLKSQGITFPKDMALITFDDTKLAEIVAGCVISSVVMPFEKMAEGGVELLERLISKQDASPVVWSFPFSFREGQTI